MAFGAIPSGLCTASTVTPYTLCTSTTQTALINAWGAGATNAATYVYNSPDVAEYGGKWLDFDQKRRALIPSHKRDYVLPDGTVLGVDDKGNFKLEDKAAQVVYLANRMREFNPYLNASDLLARFIKYLGTLGVRRQEVKDLPLNLFVNWLIVEAAEMDGDPVPDGVKLLPANPTLRPRIKPRCLSCQKFVQRSKATQGFLYCGRPCLDRHADKVLAA